VKNLDKLIPPMYIDLKLNYDLTSQQKQIILVLSGRRLFISQIMSLTGFTYEKTRRAITSLVQYGLISTELSQNKTRFKLSFTGENVVPTLIKLDVIHKNGVKPNTKLPISHFKFNILKLLQDQSLALDQLLYMLSETPDQIVNSLKYLQILDLINVESFESYFNGKKSCISLYSLTPKGDEIVTNVLNVKNSTPQINKQYTTYINGAEFGSKKKLLKHISDFLSLYTEGEFLSGEHQKFIIDCLRSTDWGINLIPSIYKIKVVTNTDCIALIKNNNSEQIIRIHGILDEWSKYHKDDVRHACRAELRKTYTYIEGVSRYHDGLSLMEILLKFITSNHLSFESIDIFREGNNLRLLDRDLASKWVEFHNKHAKILLLTDDEMNKKTVLNNTVLKCQAEFDKYNVGKLGAISN